MTTRSLRLSSALLVFIACSQAVARDSSTAWRSDGGTSCLPVTPAATLYETYCSTAGPGASDSLCFIDHYVRF